MAPKVPVRSNWLLVFASILPPVVLPLRAAIEDDLLAYWKLDGDFTEETATGAHATFGGSGSPDFYAGKFDDAIDFDGSDQHAVINGVPEATFDLTGQSMTVSVWIRVDGFTKPWQMIVAKGEELSWRLHRWEIGDNLAWAGGAWDTPDVGPGVNDGQFHHVVAITEHGVSTRLWVDGALVATGTDPPNIANENAHYAMIGGNPDPEEENQTWDGMIDDLAIWSRVLSPAEIAAIYNGGTGASIATLMAAGDTDGDGMTNQWEIDHGLNPGSATGDDGADGDPDLDGLSNLQEFVAGTHPNDPDSDDDGLLDGVESGSGIYLGSADTGTNPLVADTDGDGLTDGDEVTTQGTNPTLGDSDGDGAGDGFELVFGTDPLDAGDTPPPGAALSGISDPGLVGGFLDGGTPVVEPNSSGGANWDIEDVTPGLTFAELKGVAAEPNPDGDETFIGVVERRGTLQSVEYPGGTSKFQVLDIRSRVAYGEDGGLRTVVFHPEFNILSSPNRNYIYAFYTTQATAANGFTKNPNGAYFCRLSRFTRGANGNFGNELVMIQQMALDGGSHFGGSLVFGKDGFLYIGWGDMEFNEDAVGVPFHQDVQRIDRIFQGAILCIDVNQQGGAVSSAPTRTLQGNSSNHPNPMPGTTRSCPTSHHYYHRDNFSGVGYYIPRKNYWHASNHVPPAGTAGTSDGVSYPAHGPALEEHVAVGVRNPWRMAADPVDGDIAWFNVGSNEGTIFEEAEVLVQGGNYGWPYKEGDQSETGETGRTMPPGGNSFAPVYLGTEIQPVEFHPHVQGNNVATGGVLYQGSTLGTVRQMLINGDHGSGKIWSVDYKGKTGSEVVTELIDTNLEIRQMVPSADGEDVIIASSNDVYRLVDNSPPTPEPPSLLSQTGTFTDLTSLTPRAGLIPYEPAAPLWSDRALKARWMSIPNGLGAPGQYDQPAEKILFSASGEWSFPRGTVFIKHFTLPLDEGDPFNPAKQKNLETRFIVYGQDGGYFGYTYKWNAADTDADLIPEGDTAVYDEVFTVTRADGSTYPQTWSFPSRAQCFDCHQTAASHVLGLKTRQLNHAMVYPSGTAANQLATMNSLGMFDQTLSVSSFPGYTTSADLTDGSATLEHRVKSYLDSNCSHCHRPGSNSGQASFDARLTTPLSLMGIINVDPDADTLGLGDPKIVKPGDVANSVLHFRDASILDLIKMPPLAKTIPDDAYLEVLTKWIQRIGFPNYDAHASAAGIIGGVGDDFDGDRLPNGLEFLLQLDGAVHTPNPGFQLADNAGQVELSLSLEGDALSDGLAPEILDSWDLINWIRAGQPGSLLTPAGDTSAPGIDGVMTWRFVPGDRGFVKIGLGAP